MSNIDEPGEPASASDVKAGISYRGKRLHVNSRSRTRGSGYSPQEDELSDVLETCNDVPARCLLLLRRCTDVQDSDSRRLAALNTLAQLLKAEKFGTEVYGMQTVDVLKCLRVSLVDSTKEICAASLRCLRHMLHCDSLLQHFYGLHLDKLCLRCVDSSQELVQYLQFVAQHLKCSTLPPSPALLAPLVALSRKEQLNASGTARHHQPPPFRSAARALLCETALLHPEALLSCCDTAWLSATILSGGSATPVATAVLLHLARHVPRMQQTWLKILQQVVWALRQAEGTETDEETFTFDDDRLRAPIVCLTAVCRSWPGLRLCLSQIGDRPSSPNVISVFVDAVLSKASSFATLDVILDFLQNIFNLPVISIDYTVLFESICNKYRDSRCAVRPQPHHPACGFRPIDLSQQVLAILLLCFVQHGLFKGLAATIQRCTNTLDEESVRDPARLEVIHKATCVAALLVEQVVFLLPASCVPTVWGELSACSRHGGVTQANSNVLAFLTCSCCELTRHVALLVNCLLESGSALETSSTVVPAPHFLADESDLKSTSKQLSASPTLDWTQTDEHLRGLLLAAKSNSALLKDSSHVKLLSRILATIRPTSLLDTSVTIDNREALGSAAETVAKLARSSDGQLAQVLQDHLQEISTHLQSEHLQTGVFSSPALASVVVRFMACVAQIGEGLTESGIMDRLSNLLHAPSTPASQHALSLLEHLDYRPQNAPSRTLLVTALTQAEEPVRLAHTHLVSTLLHRSPPRPTSPFFDPYLSFLTACLVDQLRDASAVVLHSAMEELMGLCQCYSPYLEQCVASFPAHPLGTILRAASVVTVDDVDEDVRYWAEEFNTTYAQLMSERLLEASQCLPLGDSPSGLFERRSGDTLQCFGRVQVLPHLYARVAALPGGWKVLKRKNMIEKLQRDLTSAHTPSPRLQGCLYAAAHLVSAVNADDVRVEVELLVDAVVQLVGARDDAVSCTAFLCLCIASQGALVCEYLRSTHAWNTLARVSHVVARTETETTPRRHTTQGASSTTTSTRSAADSGIGASLDSIGLRQRSTSSPPGSPNEGDVGMWREGSGDVEGASSFASIQSPSSTSLNGMPPLRQELVCLPAEVTAVLPSDESAIDQPDVPAETGSYHEWCFGKLADNCRCETDGIASDGAAQEGARLISLLVENYPEAGLFEKVTEFLHKLKARNPALFLHPCFYSYIVHSFLSSPRGLLYRGRRVTASLFAQLDLRSLMLMDLPAYVVEQSERATV